MQGAYQVAQKFTSSNLSVPAFLRRSLSWSIEISSTFTGSCSLALISAFAPVFLCSHLGEYPTAGASCTATGRSASSASMASRASCFLASSWSGLLPIPHRDRIAVANGVSGDPFGDEPIQAARVKPDCPRSKPASSTFTISFAPSLLRCLRKPL